MLETETMDSNFGAESAAAVFPSVIPTSPRRLQPNVPSAIARCSRLRLWFWFMLALHIHPVPLLVLRAPQSVPSIVERPESWIRFSQTSLATSPESMLPTGRWISL